MWLFSHWIAHSLWWLCCHIAGCWKLKDFKKSTDGSETSVQYNSSQIHQGKSLALTVLLSTHTNTNSFYTAWLVVVQTEKWAGTSAVALTIQTENTTWSTTVKLNVTDALLQKKKKRLKLLVFVLLYVFLGKYGTCLLDYVNTEIPKWLDLGGFSKRNLLNWDKEMTLDHILHWVIPLISFSFLTVCLRLDLNKQIHFILTCQYYYLHLINIISLLMRNIDQLLWFIFHNQVHTES